MTITTILNFARPIGKILLPVVVLGTVSPAHAAGTWFVNVTVSRIMTGVDTLHIWGNQGCFVQPTTTTQYLTAMYSEDAALLSRIQSLASTALTTGKSVSFYVDCDTGLIDQICVSNPDLNAYNC